MRFDILLARRLALLSSLLPVRPTSLPILTHISRVNPLAIPLQNPRVQHMRPHTLIPGHHLALGTKVFALFVFVEPAPEDIVAFGGACHLSGVSMT